MSATSDQHTYSIKQAASLTGLPATTLRYYESIGVIAPINRDESSRHRIYTDQDLDMLSWVACLSATGMSIEDMRTYVSNSTLGTSTAAEQVRLLRGQQQRLTAEAEQVALRTRYVAIKIAYWQAVEAHNHTRAQELSDEASVLAADLNTRKTTTLSEKDL